MKFDSIKKIVYEMYYYSYKEADKKKIELNKEIDIAFIEEVIKSEKLRKEAVAIYKSIVDYIHFDILDQWIKFWELIYEATSQETEECVEESHPFNANDTLQFFNKILNDKQSFQPVLEKSQRDYVIGKDDILNLQISLNTCETIDDFIQSI
jgi:hypothetical protein